MSSIRAICSIVVCLLGYAHTAPALARDYTEDEVAMFLGTMLIHDRFCGVKANEFPLNVAIAKLGQDLVDFLPNNRYAPLVDVKAKKAVEFIGMYGKAMACDEMGVILGRFIPDVYPSLQGR